MKESNQGMMKSLETVPALNDESVDAKSQVRDIKQNANTLLYQLMQEQNAKLKSMVDALKKGQAPTLNSTDDQSTKLQEEPRITAQSNTNNTQVPIRDDNDNSDSTPTKQDVTSLQQNNLLHLDAVIDRINATMTKSIDSIGSTIEPVVQADRVESERE